MLEEKELEAMRAVFGEKNYVEKWRDILEEHFLALKEREDNPSAGNLVIPPEYFCTMPLADYKNPSDALAREFLQNSWDAGSRRIDAFTSDSGLTVEDNGSGMDRDIILNKLLALGGSHKEGMAVGGFGKAKELLYFCWPDYMIHSRDCLVIGMQNRYEFFQLPNDLARKGTASRIQLWNPDSEEFKKIFEGKHVPYSFSRRYFIEQSMQQVAGRSFGQCPVMLNGERCLTARRGKELMQHENATLWLVKGTQGGNQSRLDVSVNGIHMFSRPLYLVNHAYMLDFKGSSAELLTSNRDECREEAEKIFNETVNLLQREEDKFVEKKTKNVMHLYRGSEGMVFARGKKPKPQTVQETIPAEPVPIEYAVSEAALMRETSQTASEVSFTDADMTRQPDKVLNVNIENTVFACKEEKDDKGYGFWAVNIENGMGAAARHFLSRPRICRKFANMVKETLSITLAAAEEVETDCTENTAVGLTFCNDKAGTFLRKEGWPQVISVNPLEYEAALLGEADMKGAALKLLHVCTHETAHIFADAHGEYFSSMMWKLTQKIAELAPDALQEIVAAAEKKKAEEKEKEEQRALPGVVLCY